MGRLSLVFLVALLRATECGVISNKEPLVSESCRNFGLAFERMFAIPGESPLLECPLHIPSLFDPAETPYNVAWFEERTGWEISAGPNVSLSGTSLWFPNISVQSQGTYVCVLRTQTQCYRQAAVLVVSEMTSGDCERPVRGLQRISAGVNDVLTCPLKRYIRSVDHPSIQWYKNCEPLQEDEKFAPNEDMLNIRKVHLDDAGLYTCKMAFSLGGVVGEMAESVECEVHDEYLGKPRLIEPATEIIKVERGLLKSAGSGPYPDQMVDLRLNTATTQPCSARLISPVKALIDTTAIGNDPQQTRLHTGVTPTSNQMELDKYSECSDPI